MSVRRILLIGPDLGTQKGLQHALEAQAFNVTAVITGEEGLIHAADGVVGAIASDSEMPGMSGLELLMRLRAVQPDLPVVLAASCGVADAAIEAAKLGAFEYVIKPLDTGEFVALLASATQHRAGGFKLQKQNDQVVPRKLVGSSPVMQKLYKEIGLAANTDSTVLIRGETGTGKELLARAIHKHSSRSGKPFVAVNCGALSEGLLESELFGHERGSFTGAHTRHVGLFEQANQGTVFLDEIGDLSWSTQVKLLRVLQESQVQRVGGTGPVPIDTRVLAATHRDLEKAIQADHFRMDLFFRLNVMTIWAPPLSQHLDDIPELVGHFMNGTTTQIESGTIPIEPQAIEFLKTQSWPGNVRQLENVTRQAKLLCRGRVVEHSHVERAYFASHKRLQIQFNSLENYFGELLAKAEQGSVTDAYRQMLETVEHVFLQQAVRRSRGNHAMIARWLGLTRTTVRQKLIRRGLKPIPDHETSEPLSDPGKSSLRRGSLGGQRKFDV